MESSPAAAMAPPPPPAPSSRARDPLLFGSFDLPAGWGCRKPMGFCRDIGSPAAPLPSATATEAGNSGSRSPPKGAPAAQHAPASEEPREAAPRRQWNLRERTSWRDYRAEGSRQPKKLGSADAAGHNTRGFSVALTRQEIEADFLAITGRKPPRRPRKRTKSVQRQIETLCPGSSLMEMTRDRYKVNEKGGS